MKIRALGAFALLVASSVGLADGGSGLPGDHGRPFDGVMPANPPPRPPSPPKAEVRAPSMELALEAARAIVAGCKQYELGIAVVNGEGEPKLIYLPDGSEASHGYMALRKAYTAVAFKVPTSQLVSKARDDQALGARIKGDPNLIAFSGGILLKVGAQIVGAIGVSGAEPGHHDEECGLIGVQKIQARLK